jgi:hypothetical protein
MTRLPLNDRTRTFLVKNFLVINYGFLLRDSNLMSGPKEAKRDGGAV